jgi:hypothetical protein
MHTARGWRLAFALPALVLLLGLKCPLTSESSYGTVIVQNQSPSFLSNVVLTHKNGSTTAHNVTIGGQITFNHIPAGNVTVSGTDGQGNPITAGSGVCAKDQSSIIILY